MKTSVLVVGAGPIGLALAGDLGFRGIECVLIEKTDGQIVQPRMDLVGIRTMEYCRRWGIVEWVEGAGYNRSYPQDCAWVTALTGYEFGREAFPSPRDEKPPRESPQKRERCPQNFFDPVLRRFAQSWPTVSMAYETELVDLDERDSEVIATVKKNGEKATIEADYLVGCDGGSSLVRELLGIRMTGEPSLTYSTNVIFRCDNFERLHDKKAAYRFIFIGPEGTWATLVAINGRDQWRFSLIGDSERRTHSEEFLRKAIVRAVGRDFEFEILSICPWIRRQLVAEQFGTKRVFLAGDSAHLTSPTGGFGMNTGIQDAVNLSWKLEAMSRGWGGAQLLASYDMERRTVAKRNVAEATGNLKRMLSPRVHSPPKAVFEEGSGSQQARIEFGKLFTEAMRREWFANGIHLGYLYEHSPIVVPDGSPPPPDDPGTYRPTSRPGSRAPHIWLSPGKSILDYFGKEFVLLRFGPDAPKCDLFEQALRHRQVPFKTVTVNNDDARRLYERRLVLVRPDGQVAWRADDEPEDVLRTVDIVRGEEVGPGALQARTRSDLGKAS